MWRTPSAVANHSLVQEKRTFLWQIQHLSARLDSFDDAQANDNPSQKKAQSQLPSHFSWVVYTICHVQDVSSAGDSVPALMSFRPEDTKRESFEQTRRFGEPSGRFYIEFLDESGCEKRTTKTFFVQDCCSVRELSVPRKEVVLQFDNRRYLLPVFFCWGPWVQPESKRR